ncbi:MAG: hypothetical protein ABL999_13650 [Pyrinomonadaceae bacterium]
MKKLLLLSFLLFGFTGISWARAPESVKVQVGHSKTADRGRVSIKFISVLEDSRCPMNARCVWAGNAKIKLAVSVGRRRAEIVELNSTLQPQTVTVHGYRLSLQDLNPQKGQPANWPKGPAKATVSVEKV